MYHLSEALRFPSPHLATEEGIVAVGGDLRPERVLLAYQKGIFPWFEKDDFLIWWSPDPRMVLFPDQLKISKSMHAFMRKNTYEITFNKAFNEVVKACALVKRFGQTGTWITPGLMEVYKTLQSKVTHIQLKFGMAQNLWADYMELILGRSFAEKVCFPNPLILVSWR